MSRFIELLPALQLLRSRRGGAQEYRGKLPAVRRRLCPEGLRFALAAHADLSSLSIYYTDVLGITLFVLAEGLVFAVFQIRIGLTGCGYLKQVGSVGHERDPGRIAVCETPYELFRGMALHQHQLTVRGGDAGPAVKPQLYLLRGPGIVAGGDESVGSRASGHGVGAAGGRQYHPVHQYRRIAPVEIEHPGQPGIFVVPQEPGISVDLGSQDHASAEGLIDEIVFEICHRGRDAHAVVFGQAFQLRRLAAVGGQAPVKDEAPMVHRGMSVAAEYVHVGLGALPEERGHVFFRLIELETVVQHYEVGAVFAALPEHLRIQGRLFGAEGAADAVHLEQGKSVAAAEVRHEVIPLLFFFWGVAEAVGAAPQAHADADRRRFFHYGGVAPGILRAELGALRISVAVARSVKIARVPGVYSDLHAIGFLQPFEESQIGQGLLLAGAFVGAVYPGKILRDRGRPLVGACFGCVFRYHMELFLSAAGRFIKTPPLLMGAFWSLFVCQPFCFSNSFMKSARACTLALGTAL